MANSTYDLKWQEAMAELNEQLHLEDHTLGLREGEAAPSISQPSVVEAIQHWSCLYLRYLEILRNLESCYDSMLHPQKRIDVKMIMELVMSRLLEIKSNLVKWNPVHPSLIASGCEGPLPWEYVNFDDVLVDLKLPPKTLEVPIPRYFLEENADSQNARDKLIEALKNAKIGEEVSLLVESGREDMEVKKPLLEMSVEEAIECIQRCERGRQGIVRGQLIQSLSEEEKTKKALSRPESYNLDPEIAAANIQRLYRGNLSRRKAQQERDRELAFIGMRRSNQWDDVEAKRAEDRLFLDLDAARGRRKLEQKENEDSYSMALVDLHGTVLEEEGPDMREKMMDERRAWFTDELGKGIFPEDLSGFYLMKNPPAPEDENKGSDKGGKGKKDAKKKDDKGKGKGKGKGKAEEEEVEKLPVLTGPTLFTQTLEEAIKRYEEIWLDRDESDNFQQKHDVELAKNVVRPNVEEEVRENVDKMLILQLQNLKAQLEAAASGGKKGKKKKGKKDKKGKKGKKGKKDKKGKKGKALPGEKLCSGIDIEDMLAYLVELRVVNKPASAARVEALLGEFNYLGSAHQQHSEVRDAFGNWVPQDPSMSQIRQAITEHIILPLGSPFLRITSPYAKSMLLYGPKGSGKTMLAQAVANHTNALFLNLSASVLQSLPREFKEQKGGPAKLLHMAFAVARHNSFGPSVIYVDEIEKIFVGKKKGAGNTDAAKFRKDLVTYANSLKPEERVVIIGSTSEPFNIPDGELKDIRVVFQRQLYMPYPDYASRVQLWREFLERAFDAEEMDIPDQLDISALSLVSEGYSAGSILTAIRKTLTDRRLSTLKTRPLSETDFLSSLSALPCTYEEDNEKFQAFTAMITGLRDRREKVKAIKEGDGDGKDSKKKKKK